MTLYAYQTLFRRTLHATRMVKLNIECCMTIITHGKFHSKHADIDIDFADHEAINKNHVYIPTILV